MPASPLRLMDWPVPTIRHRYTRRDAAFYALSLGLGAEADDERQLVLLDPWRNDLRVLPSFALTLGYPGFWLGEPEVQEATGVAPWQVLHAEQAVRLEGALPAEGAVVGETRVVALVDKGPERGSLLVSERRILDEQDGKLLATCTQVHFLRKAGGHGSAGDMPAAAPTSGRADTGEAPAGAAPHPQEAPLLQVDKRTLPQQALLYRLNGDANPLHSDPAVATRAGFARPILHGMCTAAIAVTAVIEVLAGFDVGRARGFKVRMSRPVLPGDTLRTEVWAGGHFRTTALERDQLVLTDGHVDLREQ